MKKLHIFKSPATCQIVTEEFDNEYILDNLTQKEKLNGNDTPVENEKEQVPDSIPSNFSKDRYYLL